MPHKLSRKVHTLSQNGSYTYSVHNTHCGGSFIRSFVHSSARSHIHITKAIHYTILATVEFSVLYNVHAYFVFGIGETVWALHIADGEYSKEGKEKITHWNENGKMMRAHYDSQYVLQSTVPQHQRAKCSLTCLLRNVKIHSHRLNTTWLSYEIRHITERFRLCASQYVHDLSVFYSILILFAPVRHSVLWFRT